MSGPTKIEWTDRTWNPTAGCDKISPGCDHCYAEGIAERFRGEAAFPDGFDLTLHPERMTAPLKWKEPCMVFVNSMSDLFHSKIPAPFVAEVFATMSKAPRHTFQVLTKRPRIMERMLADRAFVSLVDDLRGADAGEFQWPLPNVWMGVSVENQQYADLRIPILLRTPAALRFLSVEPLIGSVNLRPWLRRINDEARAASEYEWSRDRVDWVIVGGESGHHARPMDPAWARMIVQQCQQWGVPVFVKQLGSSLWPKTHHDIDTFPEELQVREFPS